MIDWWKIVRDAKYKPLGKHTIDLDNPTTARIQVSPRAEKELINKQLSNIRVLSRLLKHYIEDLANIYGEDFIASAVICCDNDDARSLEDLAKRIAKHERKKEIECDRYRVEEELKELN